VDHVHVTEGSLLIVERANLASLALKFAPLAAVAIERFLGCSLESMAATPQPPKTMTILDGGKR
jgi:hypothetical protein